MERTQKNFQINESSLRSLVDDFFLILNETERNIIKKRFALNNQPRQTLDAIGKHYSLTRERIRQIEGNAIKKLQRTLMTSHLKKISDKARSILQENGGIMTHDSLISKILKTLNSDTTYSGNVVRFAIRLDKRITEVKATVDFESYYFLEPLSVNAIKIAYKEMKNFLKKVKQVSSFAAIYQKIREKISLSKRELEALAQISHHFVTVGSGLVGLSKWRSINPKSIRDKAVLILEKKKSPMHFIDIANAINEFREKKTVSIQAVHNDLIRFDEFVLVGRGMYALSKWGIPAGTVKDIIAKVLQENGPLHRKKVIELVQKARDVKVNTISLNLQKCPAFVRVGRAVYEFDKTKWEEPSSSRGRGINKK